MFLTLNACVQDDDKAHLDGFPGFVISVEMQVERRSHFSKQSSEDMEFDPSHIPSSLRDTHPPV
jgi:hypothetical protein